MKTEPEKYTTDGGASFDSEDEAKRWEKVEETTTALDEAASAWELAVMETAATADGQPFKIDRFDSCYWQIFGGYDSAPRVCKVSFYPRDLRLDSSGHRGSDVEVEYVWHDPWAGVGSGRRRPDERRTVRVDELYSTKKAAQIAACEMNAERLAREHATAVEAAEKCGADPPPALGPRTCEVCCWSLIASGRALPGNTCPGCEGKPSRLKLALSLLDELAGADDPSPDFVRNLARRWAA
ncbi:MAG: hypothetical protein GY719_26040 [bacterium]|nr:hypothetical protein [bacterium]